MKLDLFGKQARREIDELKRDVKALREWKREVEEKLAPFRIGPEPIYLPFVHWHLPPHDGRPSVELREVVEKMMAHLEIELRHEPAKPESICIVTKKKGE